MRVSESAKFCSSQIFIMCKTILSQSRLQATSSIMEGRSQTVESTNYGCKAQRAKSAAKSETRYSLFFLALHMLKKQKKIILFVLQGNGKEDSANTGKNIQKFISFTRRQLFQGEGKGTSED